MGFRFRQVLRVIPGLRLNMSKSGVSASLGVQGTTVNLGKRGIRGTVGIPGSGVSYSKLLLRSGGDGSSSASAVAESETTSERENNPDRSPTGAEASEGALDELYVLTSHLVVRSGKASTSWLQRQLRIGYSDAVELMEHLEADGIVSPPDTVGRRKVLIEIHELPELSN